MNKHLLYGMLLNNIFPKEYTGANSPILSNAILENIIDNAAVPKTPSDKINNLLKNFHSMQEYEGSTIKLPSSENNARLKFATSLYFKNNNELYFYIKTLNQEGLINCKDINLQDGHTAELSLKFLGLERVIELSNSGAISDKCFIAMSFSKEQKDTREAIKMAVIRSGFKPILVDELHTESDVTINDSIIREIKGCRFLIADFTEQKAGVYFEAGFALGLNRPVIYTCAEIDFINVHFDTNHYPHIVYSSLNDLTQKLYDKIEAWLK